MTFPALPPDQWTNATDSGEGALARASAIIALAQRASYLAQTRGRVVACSSWLAGSAAGLTAFANSETSLGSFVLPPAGVPGARVEAHFYVGSVGSGGSAQYFLSFFQPDPTIGAPQRSADSGLVTVTAPGWHVLSARLPSETDPVGVRLSAVETGGGSQVVESLCVLSAPPAAIDGETDDEQRLAFEHLATAGRPYDAYTLRAAARWTNSAANAPRVLVAHSYRLGRATDDSVVARYRLRTGSAPRRISVRAYVEVQSDSAPTTPGDMTVEVDGVASGISFGFDTDGWVSAAAEAADLPVSDETEILVTFTCPSGADPVTITVRELLFEEQERSEADALVTSGSRVDTVADRLFLPTASRPVPGAPIVADYTRRNDAPLTWQDRASAVRNALHSPIHRALSAGDNLGGVVSTSEDWGIAETLWRGEVSASVGVTALRVFALVSRSTTSEDLARLAVFATASTAVEGAPLDLPRAGTNVPAWRLLGEVPLVEGELNEVEIRGGWLSADGTGGKSTVDSLTLSGVLAFEAAPAHEAGNPPPYFYRLNAGLSVASPGTTTIIVPDDHALAVRRVRCRVTWTGGSSLALTLTSPAGTVRTVVSSGSGSGGAWYSDDAGGLVGDTAPVGSFADFIGEAKAGTWTLTATGTGTVTAFGLELW
jgi:hypothetical protein